MQTHGKVRQGNDVNNDKQTQAQPQFSPAQSGAVQVVLIGEEVASGEVAEQVLLCVAPLLGFCPNRRS